MSTEQSAKNAGMATFYIAISAGEAIADALRNFLTSVKYANVAYGEKHYKDYLKDKGHRFKEALNFQKVALDQESDILITGVTKDDKALLESLTTKLGIDHCFATKPDDFDNLVERKFIRHEKLNAHQEKIIRAFTIRDQNGNYVMDKDNPKLPQVIEDARHMLMIKEKDLARWEIVCTELERRKNRPKTLNERIERAKKEAKLYAYKASQTPKKEMKRERK